MSVIDELKTQITAGKITFDPPAATAERLRKELLGENEGGKVTSLLQSLVLEASKLSSIRISSIIRTEGHHGTGRAFDVGNEEVAASLLPHLATDARVSELKIDEVIFDAVVAGEMDRNRWNYNEGVKHSYDNATLNKHKNHIHFAVKSA